jgi:DNA repair protein RecO (recombination protein O)
MLQRTDGIIIHTTKYSENSVIAKIYTREFGLQSYIASTGKSKKGRNKALLQPLSIVQLTSTGRSDLQRITEINILHAYSDIPYNVVKSSIGIFLNEILYRSVKESHPDEDLFEFIKSSLLILDLKTDSCADFHISFMVQMSRFLGFYPQGEFSGDTPYFDLQEGRFQRTAPVTLNYLDVRMSELLNYYILKGYGSNDALKPSKEERKALLSALITYYRLHIATFGELRSHDILEQVIS